MKTIAIIPAYNEEKNIGNVISETKKYVDEVIVVDDNSSDKTTEIARSKADVVMRHIVNMGKGVALKTGFEEAIRRKADFLVAIDADGQHKPKDIPRLLKEINEVDIVIGSRLLNEKMPFVQKAGNIFIQKMFELLFKKKIRDTQSGFRVIRSKVYKKIKWEAQQYAVETEMLVNACRNNLRIKEVPIETIYLDNYKGTTVFDGIKIFVRMIFLKLR
ncbi:glycosyltransferase family 2 protein, partial [Candidatus Woesearchaeota archaeon]